MIVLARLISRLVAIALMVVIAAAGIAAAVFCIQGGHGTFSLAALAADLRLPGLRADSEWFLGQLTASGSVAIIAALGGLAAILLGLTLLTGSWVRPRPRRIVLQEGGDGTLGTFRRPLARAAVDRAVIPEDVGRARARARARRRHAGGRLTVTVRAVPEGSRQPACDAATRSLASVTEGLPVRVRVRARSASRRDRRRQEQVPA